MKSSKSHPERVTALRRGMIDFDEEVSSHSDFIRALLAASLENKMRTAYGASIAGGFGSGGGGGTTSFWEQRNQEEAELQAALEASRKSNAEEQKQS